MNTPAFSRGGDGESPGAVTAEANALIQEMLATIPVSNLVGREKIFSLQRAVAKLPQYKCPVRHFFIDGLYVREIFIPAGCVLVGYIHMFPCITTVSKGLIIISDGEKSVTLSAPHTMICQPGSKKAGYALQDTIWSDAYVNPDNERDIEKLERWLTADTHEQYLERMAERLRLEERAP